MRCRLRALAQYQLPTVIRGPCPTGLLPASKSTVISTPVDNSLLTEPVGTPSPLVPTSDGAHSSTLPPPWQEHFSTPTKSLLTRQAQPVQPCPGSPLSLPSPPPLAPLPPQCYNPPAILAPAPVWPGVVHYWEIVTLPPDGATWQTAAKSTRPILDLESQISNLKSPRGGPREAYFPAPSPPPPADPRLPCPHAHPYRPPGASSSARQGPPQTRPWPFQVGRSCAFPATEG